MTNTQRILLDASKQILLAGDDIDGRYVLEAKLGEGGMGVVFRAKQLSTKRDVALKVMKLDKVDDTSIERFQQEIDIISKLSHPNIVRVFDTGRVPNKDMVFVVMELIEGVSVNEVLWYKHAEEEYYKCRMLVGLALEIAYQVCGALTEPHQQGIIHRDIKPENILLVPRSDETVQVKLLDFGVARVLKSKKKMTDNRVPFVGTPHYMAPEQVACSQYDIRTDLYSLGVVLFELLSGGYPFDDENLLALLLRKTQYDAPKLKTRIYGDFPYPEVLQLVDDLLAQKVEDRPPTALEVRHRIEDIRDIYRFKRIRIDADALREIADEYEIGEEAYFEGLASLFHGWMTLPSGKPLMEHKHPQQEAEPEVVEEDEDSMAPTNIVPAHEFEPLITENQGLANKPVQHKIQAWQVDQEWTNSFDVNKLMRGVDEMEGMFQGPDPMDEADETIEQAITTLYKADELSDVLDGYANMSFDDEPVSSPLPFHHTPSPNSYDTQDELPGLKDGTTTGIGNVQHLIDDLRDEGVEMVDGAKEAAFAPLYATSNTTQDVMTSAQSNQQPVTASQLRNISLPLAPTEIEDEDSMADTQQVSALEQDIALDEQPEEEPFVPASFAQDSSFDSMAGFDSQLPKELANFENEWLSEPNDVNDGIDPFADTMAAPLDIDVPDLLDQTMEDGPLRVNQDEVSFEDKATNKLPRLSRKELEEELGESLPTDLNFGSVAISDSESTPDFGSEPIEASAVSGSGLIDLPKGDDEEPLELDMDAVATTKPQPASPGPVSKPKTAITTSEPSPKSNTKLYIAIVVVLVIVAIAGLAASGAI